MLSSIDLICILASERCDSIRRLTELTLENRGFQEVDNAGSFRQSDIVGPLHIWIRQQRSEHLNPNILHLLARPRDLDFLRQLGAFVRAANMEVSGCLPATQIITSEFRFWNSTMSYNRFATHAAAQGPRVRRKDLMEGGNQSVPR